MATTVHRKGKSYHGSSKVDRGYIRPQISDASSAISAASGGGVLAGDFGGTTPNITPTGPSWAKDTSNGELWFYDGATWTDTGIKLS